MSTNHHAVSVVRVSNQNIKAAVVYLRNDIHALALSFLINILAQSLSSGFDGSRRWYCSRDDLYSFGCQGFTNTSPVLDTWCNRFRYNVEFFESKESMGQDDGILWCCCRCVRKA